MSPRESKPKCKTPTGLPPEESMCIERMLEIISSRCSSFVYAFQPEEDVEASEEFDVLMDIGGDGAAKLSKMIRMVVDDRIYHETFGDPEMEELEGDEWMQTT